MDTTLNATVSYDEKHLDALRMYLKQDDAEFQATLDKAMGDAVDALFKKNVPAPVQAYIALLNGEVKPDKKAKAKKPKAPKQDEVPQATYEAQPAEHGEQSYN